MRVNQEELHEIREERRKEGHLTVKEGPDLG